MRLRLKPLSRQSIVITGATSGNGLATARRAAAAGARVMLVARDEAALLRVQAEIERAGGVAACRVADVGVAEEVDAVARRAIEVFGGFDTWVNNAGVGIYGELDKVPLAEHRRLFETNYWGVVHGSLAAVRHFEQRGEAGALINVGSINADMASPLLSTYTASKHAVRGFTDCLRLELKARRAPVSVTLVNPAAIGTPFPQHARNLTGFEPRLPHPLYAPDLVADAILHGAEHPRRTIVVGGLGRFQVLGATLLPQVFDEVATRMTPALVDKHRPAPDSPGNLFQQAGNEGQAEGGQRGRAFSLYTAVETARPATLAAAALIALAAGGAAMVVRRRLRT